MEEGYGHDPSNEDVRIDCVSSEIDLAIRYSSVPFRIS